MVGGCVGLSIGKREGRRAMSVFKTTLLLGVLSALLLAMGYGIGGMGGALMAFVFSCFMNASSYFWGDRMVLSMYGATPLDPRAYPWVFAAVKTLCGRAQIPLPKVYFLDTDQPNAFATGRDPHHGAIALSAGLLDRLSQREVIGVIAHELAHIRNRDTLIMTIAATLAGALGFLAQFAFLFGGRRDGQQGAGPGVSLVMMIVAPVAAFLVQMAISRVREYQADRDGALFCEDPVSLASALERLEDFSRGIANPRAEQNPAGAHLFIVTPLLGTSLASLFSTHPQTADRVRKLRALAAQMGKTHARMEPPPPAPTQRRNRPWG